MTIQECEAFYASLQKQKTFVKVSEDVLPVVHKYRNKPQEHFLAVLLNHDLSVKKVVVVSKGTATKAIVRPLEAFHECVKQGTPRIIFVHNHPSGNIKPSVEDCGITTALVKAGEILGIDVLDHIIIGDGHCSLRSERSDLWR